VIKDLGVHADSGKTIQIVQGPYGPYIKAGTKNMSIPEGMNPEQITMEQAIVIVKNAGPDKNEKKKASKRTTSKKPIEKNISSEKNESVKVGVVKVKSKKTAKTEPTKLKSGKSVKSVNSKNKVIKTKPSISPVTVKRKVVLKQSTKESTGRLPR
jgi:DNA topoisomerase-1